MTSEVIREIACPRYVAEVPGLPGVLAYGETALQAQIRAAVVGLRPLVLREGGTHGTPGTTE